MSISSTSGDKGGELKDFDESMQVAIIFEYYKNLYNKYGSEFEQHVDNNEVKALGGDKFESINFVSLVKSANQSANVSGHKDLNYHRDMGELFQSQERLENGSYDKYFHHIDPSFTSNHFS